MYDDLFYNTKSSSESDNSISDKSHKQNTKLENGRVDLTKILSKKELNSYSYLEEYCPNSEIPIFSNQKIPYYSVEATLKSNQTFGDLALSYCSRRTATVVASKDCTFLTLTK